MSFTKNFIDTNSIDLETTFPDDIDMDLEGDLVDNQWQEMQRSEMPDFVMQMY